MLIAQKKIRDIIKENALRCGISYQVGEKLFLTVFRFIRDTIQEAELGNYEKSKTIEIMYLGKFLYRKRKYRIYNNSKNKSKN